ncbi:Uncharacterised protein [Atlantibacter hermannii]|nr:Uncharacterised protein [Atlantibacter hermannii]
MRSEAFVMNVRRIDTHGDQLFRGKLHKGHRAAQIELHTRRAQRAFMLQQIHQSFALITPAFAILFGRFAVPDMMFKLLQSFAMQRNFVRKGMDIAILRRMEPVDPGFVLTRRQRVEHRQHRRLPYACRNQGNGSAGFQHP